MEVDSSDSVAEDTLAPLIEKLDLLEALKPQILCFSWQMDRNYIVDYRIQKLIEAGNMVVCAGGNQDLPVHDISPVAVDGTIKVGGNLHDGHFQICYILLECCLIYSLNSRSSP